eukprot:s237_g11.t1
MNTDTRKLRCELAAFVRSIHAGDTGGLHAKSCKLASDLLLALEEEFELPQRRRVQFVSIRQMQKKVQRLRAQKDNLQRQLQAYTGQKSAGQIELMWFIRTSFARDFGVTETPAISSTRIGHAKDAMVEVIKRLNREELGLAAAMQPCLPGSDESEAIIIKHVHDEATMGLRSYHADPQLAGRIIRGKYSKIQNNLVEVICSGSSYVYYQELQCLMRKDAPTIAFALRQVVENIFSALLAAPSRAWGSLRIVHCLTGDGIGTNANAARRLLRHFREMQQFQDVPLRYFLLCARCASHAANLCVQVGIVGSLQRDPLSNCDLTAALSRWFKHILPANIEEVHASFRRWLEESAHELGRSGVDEDMQILYGNKVLPNSLLTALRRENILQGPSPEIVQEIFKEISRVCFLAQERPVPTRFFLFSACVRSLLTLKLLGIPSKALEPRVNMNSDNSRRWQRFLHFYNGPSSLQRLKKTVLCLALTDTTLSITAQKPEAREGVVRDPTIVRLSRGEAQTKASETLLQILNNSRLDGTLDMTDVLSGLLTTHGHIVARFAEYFQFPFALWKLTAQYNSGGQIASIESFLDLSETSLDCGYSAQLQKQALQLGSVAAAISFLCSEHVQVELQRVLQALSASSLDVERKHAVDKRQEKLKVRSVATASRNTILQQYKIRRHAAVDKKIKVLKMFKRRRSISSASLAVQRCPDLLPRPAGFMPDEYRHDGNLPALRAYLQENHDTLVQEAANMRLQARQQLCDLSLGGCLPQTNSQWLEWMQTNEETFRALLKTATQARRSLSQRIVPAGQEMLPVDRLGPEEPHPVRRSWEKKLLQQKSGWFCIGQGNGMLCFFLISVRRQCWILEALVVGHRQLELHVTQNVHKAWMRASPPQLDALEELPDNAPVFALDITVQQVNEGEVSVLHLHVDGAEEVTLQHRKRAQRVAEPGSGSGSDSISSESDFEQDFACVSEYESLDSDGEEEDSETTHVSAAAVEEGGLEPDLAESEDGGDNPKGSNVVHPYSNTYFTLENYALSSAKEDVKMRIRPRWCRDEPEGMGHSPEKSKTIRILEFDCELQEPKRAYLVLRAWALWRARQGSWLNHRPPRQRWWQRELEAIKAAVQALNMPHGTTGSAKADEKIRMWLPEVLQ